MNTLNRVVIVVLVLLGMVACTATLAFPVRILRAAVRQQAALADYIDSLNLVFRVGACVLIALALDIVFVLLLAVELRRPKTKAIRVEQAAGGVVEVSIGSIADRLKYEVEQLQGVLRSKSQVSGKRRGVLVELDVDIAAGLEVPTKAEQIVETARQVVEEKMGLKLARPPKVNLRAVTGPGLPDETPKPPVEPEPWTPSLPQD